MGDKVNARQHILWCIYHEGVRVYGVPPGNDQLDDAVRFVADIRSEMMAAQAHNGTARNLIASLNDEEFMDVVLECADAIPKMALGGDVLLGHFRWVCHHEGYLPEFRNLNSRHEFEGDQGIRGIYSDREKHNNEATNLLAAVNNRYIKNLVDTI